MVAGHLEDQDIVIDHSSLLSNHTTEIANLKKSDEDQWSAINALRNRLPTWATLLIGGVMAYAGWVTGIAFGK